MHFPNYLIYLYREYDLYACVLVATIALIGAGMVGAGLALAFTKRR